MKYQKNIRLKKEQQKYDCDRCGFTFNKSELEEQDGILVCPECWDEPEETESD